MRCSYTSTQRQYAEDHLFQQKKFGGRSGLDARVINRPDFSDCLDFIVFLYGIE
jgi:hypothetical protein